MFLVCSSVMVLACHSTIVLYLVMDRQS